MVKHWNQELRRTVGPERGVMLRARVVNAVGAG